jgi:GNAT superfamily N-acetyltransferase
MQIRRCRDNETSTILAIVNAAAEAYREVIPTDRWHDPYMPGAQLARDVAAGVEFWGYELEGTLIGVMGIQSVRDVDLIRHAYVRPGSQRLGVGAALISHLRTLSTRRLLVGTWADATWAIRFYQREGFALLPAPQAAALLKAYWDIPERQIETSVVLERS